MAQDEKTEPATPRKLEKAREKGDVPQSQDVPILMMLLIAFLALMSPLGEQMGSMMVQFAKDCWGGAIARPQTHGDLGAIVMYAAGETARVFLPFGLLFVLTACVSLWIQVGFLLTAEKLKIKWDSFNIVKGIKRMLGPDRLYKLLKSVVKLSVYVVIVYLVVSPEIEWMMSLMDAEVLDTAMAAGVLLKEVMIYILLISVIFAVIDVVWVRYRHQKKLKMTKQEVRDEVKQRQGDPKVRSQIRRKQMELAGQRMMSAVAEADVVVTNPTHFAVAIQYRPPEIMTPRVV
ncbi:MAG: flagellar biosynthetic protein FlhB, partial [Myxococcota bacterium]